VSQLWLRLSAKQADKKIQLPAYPSQKKKLHYISSTPIFLTPFEGVYSILPGLGLLETTEKKAMV
jgi:hypothetical protein